MILVLVEVEGGVASEVSLETLALARSLSQAGGGIAIRALAIGDVGDRDALAAAVGAHGASELVHATGDAFDAYGGASWAAAVQAVREETGSVVVTAAGTPRGNEVVAHLAAASLGADVATSHVTAGDLRVALDANAPRSEELFAQLALGELDAAGRAFVREQCVLTAALLSDLARGTLLSEYVDRAALFTRNAQERAELARALPAVGIPAVYQ